MKALMLCGHGSRDAGAVTEFAGLADKLRARLPEWDTEYGYLEFAKPIIRDGLDRLRASGATRIEALPGMLFAAGHAKNDIPSVLNTYAGQERRRDPLRARTRHRSEDDPRRRRAHPGVPEGRRLA